MKEHVERLGIYGGTFSPPHTGHLYAAQSFWQQEQLDRLLIMPTFIPPHKQRMDTVSGEDRMAMCRSTFCFDPHVEVSALEMQRGGKSYTSDTLQALSAPGRQLIFLCGADMFLTLEEWHEPTTIFRLADIVYMERGEDMTEKEAMAAAARRYEEKYAARVRALTVPPLRNSSTEIRNAICSGGDWQSAVTPEVATYIKEKDLYR